MTHLPWIKLAGAAALLALVGLLPSCGSGDPATPQGGPFVPDAAVVPIVIPASCTPARASEDLRPRADLTAIGAAATGSGVQTVQTSDLFGRFSSVCGRCHIAVAMGSHQILDENAFITTFDATWLAAIESDVSTGDMTYMPPPPDGAPFSSRKPGDPVFELDRLLRLWLAQGRPADMFADDSGGMATNMPAVANYSFTPALAAAMTNLGNCIPPAADYATSSSGIMESMDAMFAALDWSHDPDTGARLQPQLPKDLSDTDLTSFDSETLAATGVIAYVPTYPLWSDGSNKLRYIRVPKGQSVRFDKATQTFDIPENTRFYKTFLRQVVDKTGMATNRKMETRLIVVRKDTVSPTDGTAVKNALFGTYVWSEDETSATLNDAPYQDGTGFLDLIRTYYTDELAYQNIANSIGPGADFQTQLTAALGNYPNLLQHYAIPGGIRCTQCHEGSPSQDFVLGFNPLQVARRANGTGGTYEPTGDDELTQLQRLIDYGVISGMTSPADVLPLEESEGTRKPRTDGELNAQAYMVGNCAHCHNPRGLPSVTKPELATAINFLPSADVGGIFELSFEQMSPIRSRGANGQISMPYITPSLRDYPVIDQALFRMDDGTSILDQQDPQTNAQGDTTWSPKYYPDYFLPGTDHGAVTCAHLANNADPSVRAFCGKRTTGYSFVPAPWRSLIYRNVDTPYAYFDDYVPFPHMPMNTPGFDCRVPRIMGDWMVGLPAVLKNPQLREDAIPVSWTTPGLGEYDDSPQPYQEVKRGDPGYADALTQAQARLNEFHAGVRYNYCQDTLSPDILDPIPPAQAGGYVPYVPFYLFTGQPPADPTSPSEVIQPAIGVPYHDHWYVNDPTSPKDWSPRRGDWETYLADGKVDATTPFGGGQLTMALVTQRQILADALSQATLSPALVKYATTPLPMGLWQVKPECQQQLAAQKKVSDFAGNRPQWMNTVNPPADAPVYMSSPGEAIYRNICFNCHGPQKDGQGIQADLLAASSDGQARPADFRDGLFGPIGQPGTNLMMQFTVPARPDIDDLGWGARYMSWMTLGGTLQKIPGDIINLVKATKIFGQPRVGLSLLPDQGSNNSANMLTLATDLCSIVLPNPAPEQFYFTGQYAHFPLTAAPEVYPPFNALDAPLIATNGDKEMWLNLCTQFSPTVVRVYGQDPIFHTNAIIIGLYYGDSYPANAQVFDQNATRQQGIDPTKNLYPACVDPAAAALVAGTPTAFLSKMPPCPTDFLQNAKVLWLTGSVEPVTTTYQNNVTEWTVKGAIATGMSVFSQLNPKWTDALAPSAQNQNDTAQLAVPPYYDACQLLKD